MENNLLKGKKVLFLGDSITEGVGASNYDKCYVKLFEKISGATVKNFGVSGTRIAPQNIPTIASPSFDEQFITRAKKMDEDADFVVVFGGTNDFGHGDASFGSFNDKNPATFYGALDELSQFLYAKYTKAQIIFLTPLHRISENSEINDMGYPIKAPFTSYVNAIREVSEYYSIPVLDLYKLSNMATASPECCNAFFADGLHPNDLGHERLAKLIYHFIINLYA